MTDSTRTAPRSLTRAEALKVAFSLHRSSGVSAVSVIPYRVGGIWRGEYAVSFRIKGHNRPQECYSLSVWATDMIAAAPDTLTASQEAYLLRPTSR